MGSLAAYAATNQDVSVFKGDDPTEDGIALGGWGSGTAAKSKEKILDGGWSIKMSTQSLYSGGRMDFTQPVTLFSNGIDTSRYIQFSFFFKDTQVINPASGTDYTWTDVEPYTMPRANKVRFVFISDTGLAVSAEEPTQPLDPDDNWVRIAVPLAKFKVKEGITEFRMKRLLIFTDVPTTALYLGEIKIVTDDKPIKVDPLDPRTVAVMDPQFFVASATAGVSGLKYSWDFDDSDGIQSESTEKIAKYIYTRGGVYNVTLTVSDVDGLKEPVTVKAQIEVTD